MKATFWLIVLLALPCSFTFTASGQSTNDPLAKIADRVAAQGKEATLNVGFARFLGLKTDQPIPLKRIQYEKDGVTNVFNVLRDNAHTIILSERRQLLATYYLTDRSGTLRRAVVNDGAIVNGGITNLNLQAAAAGFERQKKLWLQHAGQ